jgi:lysozyme
MATAKDVQARLRELGYYNGNIDGAIGPLTSAAILEALRGVPVRGVVGDAMVTSPEGRRLLTIREGSRTKAYKDSVGIWTIGVGHTSMAGAPHVTPGLVITNAEVDEILSRDLVQFEKVVRDSVKVPLRQNEFDALASLAFNIGGGAFAKSTLVKKLNAGDRPGAANAFLSWDKAGGRKLPGLTKRREAERLQFLS